MSEKVPTHPCPGPDCKAQVAFERLMCVRHWRQVPRKLKLEVNEAWLALNDGLIPWETYLEVRTRAIQAIGGTP